MIQNVKKCGTCDNVTLGKYYCDECRTKRRQYVNKVRAKARAENICCDCLKATSEPNKSYCLTCYLKKISTKLFRTASKWHLLKNLYDKQDCRCAYTGLQLPITEMELDHIIAKARGGENSIENLQWIHPKVNRYKYSLPEEDFLAFIRLVYEYKIMKVDGLKVIRD